MVMPTYPDKKAGLMLLKDEMHIFAVVEFISPLLYIETAVAAHAGYPKKSPAKIQ
jgi:hypothetical protein